METLQSAINFISSYPLWAKLLVAGNLACIVVVLILGRTNNQASKGPDNPVSSPTLKGHVYGFDNNPVPGAYVSVTTGDTTRTVSTDSNGFYWFAGGFAPPSGLLSVSSPGYTTYRENLTSNIYKDSDFKVYLTVAPHEAHTQENDRIVAGTTVDEITGDSIPDATISVVGRSEACTSEGNGNFQLHFGSNVSEVVRLRIEKPGYVSNEVSARPPVHNLLVQLKRAPK